MIRYTYPAHRHVYRHGPEGYESYLSYEPWLRDDFSFRCVFCLHREQWCHFSDGAFGIDHFIPQVIDPTLGTEYDNLVYACNRCNSFKQSRIVLNPCTTEFALHMKVMEDGTVEGLSPEGRKQIILLDLNTPKIVEFRHRLLSTIKILLESKSEDAADILRAWLRYPSDMPDLKKLRPPKGNRRPDGIVKSYYHLQSLGQLPEIY